jgi:hypothetical protein
MMENGPERRPAPPESGARHFVVGDVQWSVYEETRPEPPHCGPVLIFESAQTARRVREYPRRWRALSDNELYALS